MKDANRAERRGTGKPRRRESGPHPEAGGSAEGFYAGLLTVQERADLDKPVSLDDEVKLLRSCVRRLVRRMQRSGEMADDPKLMQTMLEAVRAIASLERVRLLRRGSDGEFRQSIHEALTGLDPYQQL